MYKDLTNHYSKPQLYKINILDTQATWISFYVTLISFSELVRHAYSIS